MKQPANYHVEAHTAGGPGPVQSTSSSKSAKFTKMPNDLEQYYFFGYPQGNFLKQICVIMALWHQVGRFPIKFREIGSLK